MSCGKKFDSGNCVADILRDIADAQTDIIDNGCITSCERSIADLLGETAPTSENDTVPVILYCKGDCKPFQGFGVPEDDLWNAFGSFYFRVKSVDEDNCAVLELLRDPNDDDECPKSPADQDTSHLRATGVCMTVDLDCFCHVTCLPAINAFDRV
ncbi:CotY/CotZ family spore coat protein [Aquibacillus sediminis]|uniref:CotY/CotZ family spore coat protein n=1 Tax=Aquibacillus sediminis TaxID=2574734 RepID=UPI0011094827|nr:CotY/CotZ family spore coat protein [Aquibacillus sediminis]